MGRSSKEEAARTRARIVETACKLFRDTGVDQISVANVMGALGLTTGGFYKHFDSKESLVAEAVALAFEQSTSAWQAVSRDESEEPMTQMARLVAFYLRPDPQRRCPMIAFAAHAASADAGEASRETYRRKTKALLESFVRPVKPKKAARSPSAAERHAMVLFAAMIGARVLKEAAGDAAWASRIRDAVLDAATGAA